MALDVESVVGCGMKREKSLRGSHALEPLHLPLPSSGRLMGILRPIVAPPTTFMAFCHSKITGRRYADNRSWCLCGGRFDRRSNGDV
jgi:hypothetical protein